MESLGIGGKALRIGRPGGRREQALAAKELENRLVRKPQDLVAMTVCLKNGRPGADRKIVFVLQSFQADSLRKSPESTFFGDQ